jgi:hypothetical protein
MSIHVDQKRQTKITENFRTLGESMDTPRIWLLHWSPNEEKCGFDVHSSVQLGNVYVRLKVQLDAHGFVCILYFALFALHVSGAVCTHHQEHKLQSTAMLKVWGCPSQYLLQWINQLLTYHNHWYIGCTQQFVLLMMRANSTRNM